MLNFQQFSPSQDAINIARNTAIYFEICNNINDIVDIDSIIVTINNVNAIINGQIQSGFSGIIDPVTRGCNVYIRNNSLFATGSLVNVSIFTNAGDINYSFTIIVTDTILPETIANPRGNIFASAQNVSLFTSKSGNIYYTIDGSIPTTSSTIYTAPIAMTADTVLKYFSQDDVGNVDYVHVELYKIITVEVGATPITTPSYPAGQYSNLTSVILQTNEVTTIYWTLTGINPTISQYDGKDTSPVTVTLSNGQNTLKFFAVDSYGNTETVNTAVYVIGQKENNIIATNVFVTHPYIKNTVDICWDNMSEIREDITGYNVYRSQVDSQQLQGVNSADALTTSYSYSKDDSSFEKINVSPITTAFYRDQTLDRTIIRENVSNQFKFSTPIDVNTDFKGQIVNSLYWEVIDDNEIFNQSNGICFTDVYGGNKECIFQSKFRIKGDFDIESGFTLNNWPVTDLITYEEVSLIAAINEFTYLKLSRVRKESYDTFISSLIINSTETNKTEIGTEILTGKFRIARFGTIASTYYYDGSNWVLISSYMDFSTADIQLKFYAKSADKPIDIIFSYLQLNNGQAFLPLMKDVRGNFVIQVQHYPIVSRTNDNEYSDDIEDVNVYVDNRQAIIKKIDGVFGVITFNTDRVYDYVLQKWIEPPTPTPNSVVEVVYQYRLEALRLNLNRLPYYKVTTILSDGSESRLEWCAATTLQSDKLDYPYKEAIRRNAWLLDQVGERVLLFIRKTVGQRCPCYLRVMATHKQPQVGLCNICWGTGYIGGYIGPFEIKISPFQSDQKIVMTDRGMKFENIEETWMTVTPRVSQRDFIVRRNSQIYALGPVKAPEVRGIITQQHFSVQSVDTTDIRYKFVQSLNLFNYCQNIGLRKPLTHYTEDNIVVNGEVTANDVIRTIKGTNLNSLEGRTISFENMG